MAYMASKPIFAGTFFHCYTYTFTICVYMPVFFACVLVSLLYINRLCKFTDPYPSGYDDVHGQHAHFRCLASAPFRSSTTG